MSELDNLKRSTCFDPIHFRSLPSVEILSGLPTMKVTKDELKELKCSWWFNGVEWYRDKIALYPDEVGHDEAYRYTCP